MSTTENLNDGFPKSAMYEKDEVGEASSKWKYRGPVAEKEAKKRYAIIESDQKRKSVEHRFTTKPRNNNVNVAISPKRFRVKNKHSHFWANSSCRYIPKPSGEKSSETTPLETKPIKTTEDIFSSDDENEEMPPLFDDDEEEQSTGRWCVIS